MWGGVCQSRSIPMQITKSQARLHRWRSWTKWRAVCGCSDTIDSKVNPISPSFLNIKRLLRNVIAISCIVSMAGSCSPTSEKQNVLSRSLKLPGSELPIATAVKDSDLVVLVRIVEVGPFQPGPPGQVYYDGLEIELKRTYKGNAPTRLKASLAVQKLPQSSREDTPVQGSSYLMFIRVNVNRGFDIIKVVEPRKEILHEVTLALRGGDKGRSRGNRGQRLRACCPNKRARETSRRRVASEPDHAGHPPAPEGIVQLSRRTPGSGFVLLDLTQMEKAQRHPLSRSSGWIVPTLTSLTCPPPNHVVGNTTAASGVRAELVFKPCASGPPPRSRAGAWPHCAIA